MHIEPLTHVRPLAIAHRAGNHPTRASVACEAGADIVELDVWRYRGRLEVRHTKTIWGIPLLWDRWSVELGWRPRLFLDNALAAIPSGTGVMLDLKGRAPELPGDILRALDRSPRRGTVAICSQNWALVDTFADHPQIIAIHSVGRARKLPSLFRHLRTREPAGGAAISIHQRLLTEESVRSLKTIASTIITWPINDVERAHELAEWGVDGMISDEIEVLRAIVAERGG